MLLRRFTGRLLTGPLAFLLAGAIDLTVALVAFRLARGRRG